MDVVHWRSVLSRTKRHSKLHEPRLQWHTSVLQWCLLLSSHPKGVLPEAQRTEVKKGQAAFTGELAQYIYMCKTKTGCSFTISSLRGRGGVWKKIVTGKSSPKAVLDVGCPWGSGIQRLSPSPRFRTCLKYYPSFIAQCGVGSGFSEAALQSNFSLCPALLPSTLYRGYAQKHISIISSSACFPGNPTCKQWIKRTSEINQD